MLKFLSRLRVMVLRSFGIIIHKDTMLWPHTFISKGFANGKQGRVSIGDRCELSSGTVLKAYGGKIEIGSHTFLGEYVIIYGHGGVEIGSNTLIAMHTCIVSANHTIPDRKTLIRSERDILLPVKIGNDVWIGAGARILGGVTIGDGCVIAAGCVVSKSLPPYAIAAGVPARIIRFRND
ncbi:acyltransferase [Mucilaginibacter sp. AW1-7]|uniref:acyltransferase n=1 Tax=Mucilaginibacter sp. AW1-7 TaxID=3349874 RepID=UPI003F7380EC